MIYLSCIKSAQMKSYPKKEKKPYQPRFLNNGQVNPAGVQPTTKRQKEQLAMRDIPCSWINADGTRNNDAYNDFLEEREKAAWASKSF